MAKYRLNPTLRDVYVEGSFDKGILRWFLDANQMKDVVVTQINLIDVPSSVLTKYQLNDGVRSRVVALCRELTDILGQKLTQAKFVVDADYDRLLGKTFECDHLLVTDYTCMEMYVVNESILSKYITVVLGCDAIDIRMLIESFSEILGELFLIRAANEALSLAIRWLSIARSCELKNGVLEFDRTDFIKRLVNASAAAHAVSALEAKIDELRPVMSPDIKQHANGHDFMALLLFQFDHEAKRCGFPNEEAVSSSLRGCLELAHLEREGLFLALTAALSANSR